MSQGLIWLSVAAVFTLPTALVLYVIFRNHRAADLYYQGLYHSLEQERLGKLLKEQGVSLDHYVRSNSSTEVFNAIKRCRGCVQQDQCDRHLEQHRQDLPADCENRESIARANTLVEQPA